jgi:serine/threonine protein phosphatase PrpC
MTRVPIDIGIAQLALPGETQSGDRCVVKTSENRTLIGVIDGLGHGSEAADAAAAAAEVLETFAHESVGALMQRCHERLRDTRGAAITLMVFDTAVGELQWVGAGNVAAALLHIESSGRRSCQELLVRGGMAGSLLPSTEASRLAITRSDVVVVATDGLHPGFADGIGRGEPPQQLAERLLAQYRTAHDDALVVVARLQG